MSKRNEMNIDGIGMIIMVGCILIMLLALADHNYLIIAIVVAVMIILKVLPYEEGGKR